MNAPKFTPGPWEVREHEFEGLCIHAPTVEARTACEYRVVENVNGDSTTRPKYGTPNANARLIAAAPELYEALAELLRVDDEWHGAVNSEMSVARSKARAALARALGETP